tara:strand:- start:45 stop:629 length:585 start_codon:yes stop_codon:yes gene_type:complete
MEKKFNLTLTRFQICFITVILTFLSSSPLFAESKKCPSILNHKFNKLQDDTPQNLCQYSGNVTLVVNTASFCGFTSQYEGLEELYEKYKDKGFVILGFPSNDFNQEPGENKDIADFCFNTYGVKFPMFAKSSVKGENANPLFAQLIKETGRSPRWNFNKYLLDRDGKLVSSYGSTTHPSEKKFIRKLEDLLTYK